MKHYIEVEVSGGRVMNKVCEATHKWIVTTKNGNTKGQVAVSFPEYGDDLGGILRVHGDIQSLENYRTFIKACSSMIINTNKEKVMVSSVKDVPHQVGHVIFKRFRPKMSESRLKRLVKRGNITENGIKRYKRKMVLGHTTNLPYMGLNSESNGQYYNRYVEKIEVKDECRGTFDAFGMSKSNATVPWF